METRMGTVNTGSGRGGGNKWYRERWPWILMAGPAIVVLAGFVTLWLAIKSNDGLVADDYYKQGIAINKTLARDERAAQLGLKGEVNFTASRIELRLTGRQGIELPARLRVVMSHGTRAGLDKTFILHRQDDAWIGEAAGLTEGHWSVILEDEGGSWRLTGSLRFPGQRAVTLSGAPA